MLDVRQLFKERERFKANFARRGLRFDGEHFVRLFEAWRAALSTLERLSADKNAQAKCFYLAMKKGASVESPPQKVDLEEAKVHLAHARAELDDFVLQLPNWIDERVPEGESAADNQVVKIWREVPVMDFPPKDHIALTDDGAFGSIDLHRAALISGSRFSVLTGTIAQLHRALSNFMLDLHVQKQGYTEVTCPYLVRKSALYGTGQLPKFLPDLFSIEQRGDGEPMDQWYLIPTGEVPLVNLLQDARLSQAALPIKWVTRTACFRSEAGSYGKDVRGLIRQHQFEKVELVQAVLSDQADAALESMTADAEAILEALELPYRRVLLCAKDIGFTATKTYDLEVWLPSQQAYREISSCSNCGDFQARRINAKVTRALASKPKGSNEWVHTLNGSALAVGRTLVAMLENHQTASGNVKIPVPLQPYLQGKAILPLAEPS